MIDIDSWVENYREEERIRCPYCNFDVSYNRNSFEMYEHGIEMSYHGWPDQEDITIECPSCGEEFKIREHVRRTFDTCKVGDEFE